MPHVPNPYLNVFLIRCFPPFDSFVSGLYTETNKFFSISVESIPTWGPSIIKPTAATSPARRDRDIKEIQFRAG